LVIQFVRFIGQILFAVPHTSHSSDFHVGCNCTGECVPSVVNSNACNKGDYAIDTTGGVVCLKFGSAVEGAALPDADVDSENLVGIGGDLLVVSINGAPAVTYKNGSLATRDGGSLLRALILLGDNGQGVFFSECGPFVVQDGQEDRKRTVTQSVLTRGLAVRQTQGSMIGDPHLAGAHGIKFDVFGAPGANYSLLATPAFEVNMQLAKRGPKMRFMTAMSVLYRGKSFTITPWTAKAKRAELIKHFESLGSKISVKDDRIITIELCTGHTVSFATLHIERDTYLNFRMELPGCHDSYDGLLGQTYKCKYAKEKFTWSREREEEFRVATLETASGSYSPTVACANEDEYRGGPMSADLFSKKSDALPTH
jgi:hypothetical protein